MENGKKRLQPIRSAWKETFRPDTTTTDGSVHLRAGLSLKRVMAILALALLPCVFMALWNTGYQMHLAMQRANLTELTSWQGMIFTRLGGVFDPAAAGNVLLLGALHFVPILLTCWLCALFWEGLFAVVRKLPLNEGWGITGLLLALSLPPDIPLWQLALAVTFGTVLGKEIFGGTGRNFLNPALTAYAFLFFAYPAQFAGAHYVPVDGITQATPLARAAEGGLNAVTEGFSWFQAFVGAVPGAMGETSALACLIGAVILLCSGIASWRIMTAVLLGAFLLSELFFVAGSQSNPLFQIPFHWHLVLGSLAFGLVFMATDPVTSAWTPAGQWLYGLLIGAMIILVRVLNPAFSEGTLFAILFGNVFAPVIDHLVIRVKRRERRLHET